MIMISAKEAKELTNKSFSLNKTLYRGKAIEEVEKMIKEKASEGYNKYFFHPCDVCYGCIGKEYYDDVYDYVENQLRTLGYKVRFGEDEWSGLRGLLIEW